MAALSRFCTAVFLAAALSAAAIAGRNVSTDVHASTTYYEGPRFRGGSNQTTNYNSPYRALPDGRVQHRIYGSVTIDATKVKTPWYGHMGWTKGSVQRAAKAALRGVKASGWGIVAGLAIEKLLTDAGFFIDDEGRLLYHPDAPIPEIVPLERGFFGSGAGKNALPGNVYDTPTAACAGTYGCDVAGRCNPVIKRYENDKASGWCVKDDPNIGGGVWWQIEFCPVGTVMTDRGCARELTAEDALPVTPEMLDGLDLSNYQPNDKDAEWVRRYLGRPDRATYDPIPPYTTPTETTANPDGTVTETTSTHESQITPQDGPYTSSPGITTHTVSRSRDFKDGKQSGEHTSETTSEPPPAPEGSEGNESGTEGGNEPGNENGGQSGNQQGNQNNQPQPQPQNIPTDCDFFPTLCAWLEWTKQDPPEEPELEQLKPVEGNFDKKANISFGSKTCPQPVEVRLTFFGNHVYHIDFAPFCRIAEMFYYFVMAMAYFVAARILVGEAK